MPEKFTIADRIVRDSLASVSQYTQNGGEYTLTANGGIVLQLYAQSVAPELLRSTSDLDLIIFPHIRAPQFREDVAPILGEPLSMYAPTVRAGHHVLELGLHHPSGLDFLIHSYRYSSGGFERSEKNMGRQTDNANIVRVPGYAGSIRAVRVEDIMAGKATRLRILYGDDRLEEAVLQDYKKIVRQDWDRLAEHDFIPHLWQLERRKKGIQTFVDRGKEELLVEVDKFRGQKDVFDMALLSKLVVGGSVPFDEQYYAESLTETAKTTTR